jgi:hypothetical protein
MSKLGSMKEPDTRPRVGRWVRKGVQGNVLRIAFWHLTCRIAVERHSGYFALPAMAWTRNDCTPERTAAFPYSSPFCAIVY